MSLRSNQKQHLVSGQLQKKKHVNSVSCTLEPTIWSCDTGLQIPCFDRCQLIITWMSNIKKVNSKPRLHVSVNLVFEYGRHVVRLRHHRHAYAPRSNVAGHDNHEKINSWVSFSFLYEYGAPIGGHQSSAIIYKYNTFLSCSMTCFSAS